MGIGERFRVLLLGHQRLRNVLDLPLAVPKDLDPRGYLDPGQVIVVRPELADYLLGAAGYGGRLERTP